MLGQTLVTEVVLAVLTTTFYVHVVKSLWKEKLNVFTVTTSKGKRRRGKNPHGINKVNMKEGESIKQERRK